MLQWQTQRSQYWRHLRKIYGHVKLDYLEEYQSNLEDTVNEVCK